MEKTKKRMLLWRRKYGKMCTLEQQRQTKKMMLFERRKYGKMCTLEQQVSSHSNGNHKEKDVALAEKIW